MKRMMTLAAACACALAMNCGREQASPIGPTAESARSTQASSVGSGADESHGIPLTAESGSGAGTVNVSPTSNVEGSFSAEITVSVHDAPPDTTLYVQRAPEVGRPLGADGICQRAAGLPPWGPPTPNFVTFPLPTPGPLTSLTTSEDGSGVAHFEFNAPSIPDGARFDVMFRLVDDLSTPTVELRSACFTVTVK